MATYAYITAAELQAALFPGDVDPAVDPALLLTLIQRASEAINVRCRRVFTQVTETRHFDAPGDDLLVVPDLLTVSAIAVGGTTLAPGEYQLIAVEPPAYELTDPIYNSYTAIRRLTAGIPLSWRAFWAINLVTPFAAVAITGTWGYNAVPLAIAQATEIIACRLWQRRLAHYTTKAGPSGWGSASGGPLFDDDVLALIGPYIRRIPPRIVNPDLPFRW